MSFPGAGAHLPRRQTARNSVSSFQCCCSTNQKIHALILVTVCFPLRCTEDPQPVHRDGQPLFTRQELSGLGQSREGNPAFGPKARHLPSDAGSTSHESAARAPEWQACNPLPPHALHVWLPIRCSRPTPTCSVCLFLGFCAGARRGRIERGRADGPGDGDLGALATCPAATTILWNRGRLAYIRARITLSGSTLRLCRPRCQSALACVRVRVRLRVRRMLRHLRARGAPNVSPLLYVA